MNKKITLILILLVSTFQLQASAVEVANNIFQEYKQVLEMIRQFEQLREQILKDAEILNNLSGLTYSEISELERILHDWLPEGDELYYPTDNAAEGTYSANFNQWWELMDLKDLSDVYDIDPINPSPLNKNLPKYLAEERLQRQTVASIAYGETMLNQLSDRNEIVRDYLMRLSTAESMKESVDINSQILSQAVYNQIEQNRTMSMLLALKSAEGQRNLTQDRWYQNFLNLIEE